MPNRKNSYKDMEKFRKTRRAQNKRYYQKTSIYKPRRWTPKEDAAVLAHNIPDKELSEQIKRSVKAIQIRRCNLKKRQKEAVEV